VKVRDLCLHVKGEEKRKWHLSRHIMLQSGADCRRKNSDESPRTSRYSVSYTGHVTPWS
jgi:hypothetical protein